MAARARLIWSLSLPTGQCLWEGNVENAPSHQFLKEHVIDEYFLGGAMGDGEKDELLVHLACEVVRNAPAKFVGMLLSCLSCAFWEDGGLNDLYVLC